MRIKKIKLTNFRNYQNLELEVDNNINLFQGKNGQGKTNLVEAIYFASLLKSFRESELKPLILKDAEYAIVEIEAVINNRKTKLKTVINRKTKKMFINNKEIKRQSDYIGHLNVVSFTPKDVFLFQQSPKDRRDFFDDEISKLSPSYQIALTDYNKLIKERNEILKSSKLEDTLIDVIDRQLAKLSIEIISRRYRFVEQINQMLDLSYKELVGEAKQLKLNYQSFIKQDDISFEKILAKIKERLSEDKTRQTTSVGLHRDDYQALLNEQDLAQYGSQGQQRISIIALKIALIEIVDQQIGEKPILVLDDVMSELDLLRQQQLINLIGDQQQNFITTTMISRQLKNFQQKSNGSTYEVEQAVITKEEN